MPAAGTYIVFRSNAAFRPLSLYTRTKDEDGAEVVQHTPLYYIYNISLGCMTSYTAHIRCTYTRRRCDHHFET